MQNAEQDEVRYGIPEFDIEFCIENNTRTWYLRGEIILIKDLSDPSFSLQDCELSWFFLSFTNISESWEEVEDISYLHSSRCNYEPEAIKEYRSETDINVIRNILETKLPADFYLSKHIPDRDWSDSCIAKTYYDIYNFFDASGEKISLGENLSSIWSSSTYNEDNKGLPTLKYTLFDYETTAGLRFHEINKLFFPFYKGTDEFPPSLTYGIGRA